MILGRAVMKQLKNKAVREWQFEEEEEKKERIENCIKIQCPSLLFVLPGLCDDNCCELHMKD